MVLAKNDHFSHLQFLGKSSQVRSFFDILDREECFLGKKRPLLKNSKKSKIFFKGLVHGLWPKMVIFLI